MTDFVTNSPGDSPTEGLDEQAPIAPYVPSSVGDVFKTNLFNDTSWLFDQIQKGRAMQGAYDPQTGQQIAAPEARLAPEKLKAQFPNVTGIDEPLPLSVVQGMQSEQKAKAARADVQARYPSGVGNTILGFGAGAAASLLDPVDDAAFMVPVVGEARYATWLGRAGEAAGILGRGGVTLGVGAARGAAGGAIIASGRYALGDPDMALGEVATQTLESGLAGGILHGAFAFRSDILGRRFAASPEGAAAAGDVALHDHATRAAAAQIADGQPVEVRPVFDADRYRRELMSTTAPPPEPPTGHLDEAVARAAGQPSNDAMRTADQAAQARAMPPDKVLEGSLAEAERAVEEMRAAGILSPEDERELAILSNMERGAKLEAERQSGRGGTSGTGGGDLAERIRQVRGGPSAEPMFHEGASVEENPAKHPIPVYIVGADTAVTPTGRSVPVKYALAEADDLVPSQTDSGRTNPDYPQELQPRDRSRAVSDRQISEIAQKLNPRLLDKSPMVGTGAPVISPDGVVESGNGRILAVRRAYGQGLATAQAYKAHLAEQGYPVDGMKKPVLVRVRQGELAPEERQAFTREANERDTLGASATERAMADAAAITPDDLDLYRGGDIDSAGNRDFVRRFMDRAVGQNEQAAMVGADGGMSQDAIRRVQTALLAKAYGDDALVADLAESPDANIKALGGALTDVSGTWAQMRREAAAGHIDPAMDQTDALLEAVRLVQRARRDGQKIGDMVGQTDIFSGKAVSPEGEAFLRLFFRDTEDWKSPVGRAKLADALRFYADEASKTSAGADLLGERGAEPGQILDLAKRKQEAQYGGPAEGQGDLLAGAARGAGERAGLPGEPGNRPDIQGEEEAGRAGPAPVSGPELGRAQAIAAPTFYSALTRSIENIKQERAPAEQWRNVIDNLPSVKKEEVDWSGVKEWLDGQHGIVSKPEVLDYLRGNEVQVQEVEKGRGARAVLNEAETKSAGRNIYDVVNEQGTISGTGDADYASDLVKELGEARGTKFPSYVLPGGENYRELLLTLPSNDSAAHQAITKRLEDLQEREHFLRSEGETDEADRVLAEARRIANGRTIGDTQDFRSGHFDEPNILAHVRFDDRTGPNGEKVLHIAEIQSDWHQSGRRKGYKGEAPKPVTVTSFTPRELDYAVKFSDGSESMVGKGTIGAYATIGDIERYFDNIVRQKTRDLVAAHEKAVHDAPFKSTWQELAAKRMLRYAAEHGYDRLSWDTGETQAARYDLSKQVSRIDAEKRPDGTYGVEIFAKDGQPVGYRKSYTPVELAEHVGKDLADKISKDLTEVGTEKSYQGLDLKVGGEGMKGFYDKILPAFLNKYAKKWGAKVEDSAIAQPDTFQVWAANDLMAKLFGGRWHVVEVGKVDAHWPIVSPEFKTKNEAEQWRDANTGAPTHSLPITPAMRESVMQGQPLFQRGEGIGTPTAGERVPLTDGLIATMPDRATPEEAKIIDAVGKIAARIVPTAKIYAARALESREGFQDLAGHTDGGLVAGATYLNGARRFIAWSLQSPDAKGTVVHEAVHFLRGSGFLKADEWSALEKAAAENNWQQKFDIENRYPNASPEIRMEEAIAEAGREWNKAPDWVPEAVRPIFQKIHQLLSQVADFLRQTFGANATANDVFSRIMSGEAGARTPEGGHDVSATQHFAKGEEESMIAARRRLTMMQDIIKSKAMLDKVQGIRDQGLSLAHGFDALTRGISEAVHGARDSTAQQQLARQNEFMGRLVSNLEKVPGAMQAWARRTETANWVRELAELNKTDGQPGISKSPLALKIAKAVHDAQDLARFQLNRSGAWVGDYDGYVSRTRHNAVSIHNAGYEKWRSDTLAGLDWTKTFADLDPSEKSDVAIEKFMRNLWDALSTGVHMSADHGQSLKTEAFVGMGNVARRASSERTLHWKDADAWRTYQEKYGDPVIERGVMDGLIRSGRDAALMERWGSQPQVAFENLVRKVREQNRGDHDAIAKLDAALPRLKEEFAHLTGEASRPGTSLAWKIRGSIVAAQDIAKLGNVLLAHMSVGATKPFQLQYHGVGRWQSYTSVLRNLAQDRTPEGRGIMENLRANATGQFQALMSGYEPIDGIPGQIAALRQMSMRIGGLPWMIARQKSGSEWELANFLGQNLEKTYDQLEMRTRRGLGIYGIGAPEWDALRLAGDHEKDGSGSRYLTPAAASRADVDNMAAGRLAKATSPEDADRIRGEVRDRLGMKLAAYYSDSADRSTITPGIPERAFLSLHAGRFAGPMVGQYKTWAMAAVRQMWGQAIYGSSRAEAVKSLAELVAVGTALGYARIALTDGFQGKEPQTFSGDWKKDVPLMSKAMLAGGGLGIFGDYLMGQFSRYSQTGRDRALEFVSNLAGPAVGDVASLYGIGSDIATAAFQRDPDETLRRSGAEMERFIADHMPFVNAFYLKKLAHWLVIDRLNEAANPGYLQRSQENVKRQTGQDFWLPPTHYLGAPQ